MSQTPERWVLFSTRPGYLALGRKWDIPEIIEVQNFDGQRPDPPDGVAMVLSPGEMVYIKGCEHGTPIKSRKPGEVDRKLAEDSSHADQLAGQIKGLEKHKAQLEAQIKELHDETKKLEAANHDLENKLEGLQKASSRIQKSGGSKTKRKRAPREKVKK